MCSVLILIVLEVGPGLFEYCCNSINNRSLNPYCTGSRSRTQEVTLLDAANEVLILIVLEVGPGPHERRSEAQAGGVLILIVLEVGPGQF